MDQRVFSCLFVNITAYQQDVEQKTDNAWLAFTVAASVIHSFTFACIANTNNGYMMGILFELEPHLHIIQMPAKYISQCISCLSNREQTDFLRLAKFRFSIPSIQQKGQKIKHTP